MDSSLWQIANTNQKQAGYKNGTRPIRTSSYINACMLLKVIKLKPRILIKCYTKYVDKSIQKSFKHNS